MLESLSLLHLFLLVIAGVIAGFVNTLAGGGSFLTLPALMMLGMPADVANGTNRVGVLIQSLAGVKGFDRHGMFDRAAVVSVLAPTLTGALAGAVTASYLPTTILKPVLLVTMILMAVVMVVKPSVVSPPEGTVPKRPSESPSGYAWLFFAGLYGGFIQAGVGFILLVALSGALRYDLIRANALKMACTALFSIVALSVFVLRDQVQWLPGLVLALAQVIGVQLSVRFALRVSQTVLRWLLLVMVIAVSVAAWFS